MVYSDELGKLDKVARNLFRGGNLKSLTVCTHSGYFVEISEAKYYEAVKSGQNPITQIYNVTATATATSSLSLSQEIQNIIRSLEESNMGSKKLSGAKRRLNTLKSELNKPNPNEKVIKKIIRWASDFSLELFLRLAVLIAERFVRPT